MRRYSRRLAMKSSRRFIGAVGVDGIDLEAEHAASREEKGAQVEATEESGVGVALAQVKDVLFF